MIMGLSIVLAAACAAAMAFFSATGMISAWLMLSVLVVFGVARAFLGTGIVVPRRVVGADP